MGKKIAFVLILALLLVSVAGCYQNINVNYEYGLVIDKNKERGGSFLARTTGYCTEIELSDGSLVEVRGSEVYSAAEIGEQIWLKVVRTSSGIVRKVTLGGKG